MSANLDGPADTASPAPATLPTVARPWQHPDLTIAKIDTHATEGREYDLAAWLRPSRTPAASIRTAWTTSGLDLWLRHIACRRRRAARGLAGPGRGSAAGTMPVATYASCDGTPSTSGGGRRLPLQMISDITVSPTHRRQGLLRTLITDDLAEAAAAGPALGRTHRLRGHDLRSLRLRSGRLADETSRSTSASRFALHSPPADGRQPRADRAAGGVAGRAGGVRRGCTQSTRGSVERPDFYAHDPHRQLRLDARGTGPQAAHGRAPRHRRTPRRVCRSTDGPGPRTAGRPADLVDLVALSPAVDLRLWRFLADIDLVRTDPMAPRAPGDDPVEWAVIDPRVVST